MKEDLERLLAQDRKRLISEVAQYEMKMRGTGRTRRQMQSCQQNAIYVWCNSNLHYAKRMALEIGRADLKIVSPAILDGPRFHGLKYSEIVLDHACHLTSRQFAEFMHAKRFISATSSPATPATP